jgi:hypothetical protein
MAGGVMEEKISEYEFVIRAIKKLKKLPYKSIHSVSSGFNQAFREYFNKDPVEATTKLAQEGKIVTRPVKGGARERQFSGGMNRKRQGYGVGSPAKAIYLRWIGLIRLAAA